MSDSQKVTMMTVNTALWLVKIVAWMKGKGIYEECKKELDIPEEGI